uniref:Uncharacterized protein n=1 Tax=Anguilla anguilla TaxID=7936 RepID=A0A0E9PZF9_ANGAN
MAVSCAKTNSLPLVGSNRTSRIKQSEDFPQIHTDWRLLEMCTASLRCQRFDRSHSQRNQNRLNSLALRGCQCSEWREELLQD